MWVMNLNIEVIRVSDYKWDENTTTKDNKEQEDHSFLVFQFTILLAFNAMVLSNTIFKYLKHLTPVNMILIILISTISTGGLIILLKRTWFKKIEIRNNYVYALRELHLNPTNKYLNARVINAGKIYYASKHKNNILTEEDERTIQNDLESYRQNHQNTP